MDIEKKHIRTFAVLIAFALIVTWGLFRPEAIGGIFQFILSILMPFILGFSVAFIVNLLLRPVERGWDRVFRGKESRWLKKLKRSISIFFSLAIITTAFFVLLFIVLPEVAGTFVLVADALPQYAAHVETWWEQLADSLESYGVVLPQIDVNFDDLGRMVSDWFTEQGPALLGKTLGFTSLFAVGVFRVIVGLVFSLYVLAEKERLIEQIQRVLHAFLPEEQANGVVEVGDLANTTFAKFVTGQLTDAFIVGVLCYIGMLVLAIPHAGAVSVLVGATTIIPVIGVLFGTAVGALLILVVDPMKALWFVVFIIILQQLESNYIYPKVVGKSIGLPGIWVLAAVTIGGITFGVLGMLLAVPIASVLYALLRRTVNRRLEGKALGR